MTSKGTKGERVEDRRVSREIHRLFWRANFEDAWTIWATYALRFPAFACYHILIPLQIAYGVQAIVTRHFGLVDTYAWRTLFAALGYCVFWTLSDIVVTRNGMIGAQWLQKRIFQNFLHKDYEFYSNVHFGSLGSEATRLREAYLDYCVMVTLNIPLQATIVVAGIAVIGYHSLMLALLTLGMMAAILSFTIVSSVLRLKYRRLVSAASSALSGKIGDALTHGATVKSFATEDVELEMLDAPLGVWARAQRRSWLSALPGNTGRMFLSAFVMSVLLILPGHLYQDHRISVAMVALVQLYIIKMISATQDIANIVKQYEGVMSTAHQSVRTMLIEPSVTDPAQSRTLSRGAADISFKDVHFRYDDANTHDEAVRNFSLDIKAGEKIGIVGYSGSGKTTLTKLLLRFLDVTGGSIELGGMDIRELAQKDVRRQIAYVPQEPLLFHRSIADNIAYGRLGADKKAREAATKMAYVDEFALTMPKGYDTIVGEHGVKLSGGQRQRVAIARALLKDAPILVLDEATSALDSRSEKLIQQALLHLMKDRTALVIAHRLSTIQHMDRIVVMDKGRIVQQGSHEELLEQKGIYAELWSHQSGGYIAVPSVKAEA